MALVTLQTIFQDAFPACVTKHYLVPRLFCPAKAHQIGLDRNVRHVCGFQHEGHQPTHASATAQDYVIPEILNLRADGGFFGVLLGAM